MESITTLNNRVKGNYFHVMMYLGRLWAKAKVG